MRADQFDIRLADGRHTNEVVGAREEGGKRGDKRNFSTGRDAGRGAQHILFGNKVFEEAVGKALAELFTVGGILHVGIKGNHEWICLAERQQRGPEGFASSRGVTQLIG